jgi:hypothetical protein
MTKKRRCLISAAILAAGIGIVVAVVALLPPQAGVTKANFDRIEKGMTFTDVATLFGAEPWFDDTTPEHRLVDWRHEDGAVGRVILVDGMVTEMFWFESDETYPDKLRRWLQLPK